MEYQIAQLLLGELQSSQGQVGDPVGEVAGLAGLGYQSQVQDTLADRDLQLVGVDESGEHTASLLSARRFYEKVCIPTEQDQGPARRLYPRARCRRARGRRLVAQ
jgi:hypothetical protein